jgi:alkaline phosphatase
MQINEGNLIFQVTTMLHLILGRGVIILMMWLAPTSLLEVEANQGTRDENVDYWIRSGQQRLYSEIRRQQEAATSKGNAAKNVIIFIGDGMGMSTITATRIYKNQLKGGLGEETGLSFEQFPFVGLAKTYEVDFQVIRY